MNIQPELKKAGEIVQEVEQKAKKALTVLWNDLESWQQDNQYIKTGYRPTSNSYKKSAASLGYLHNESVNIYTHLIGAVLAAIAGTFFYSSIRPRFQHATDEDVLVFSCYFLGAILCLGMSATYHTISNHSEHVTKFGNKLDYIGIVFLIWGSFVGVVRSLQYAIMLTEQIPSIYYGFSARPDLVRIYWSMITSIGLGTLTVVLYPKFRTPEWRPVRAFMFVAMGLSAVVPVIHGIQLYGVQKMEREIGLSWLVSQGVLYVVGAFLYAARIPERWRPGSFDIWGSSHQIFHVLVVLAAAAHLVGLVKAFDNEHFARIDAFKVGQQPLSILKFPR